MVLNITNEHKEEALHLARRIALFNSKVIYYVKNSMFLITEELIKTQKSNHEKFKIIIKTNYPSADPEILLADPIKNHNHDLTKLDIELIQEMLLEGLERKHGVFE